jgi:sugar O-acyltransferase (sialic acid O-acetyltransferase NeuD family)
MRIILVGASGQAKVIADIVKCAGEHQIVGVCDRDHPPGSDFAGFPVLGRDTELAALAERHGAEGAIIAIGDNWVRGLLADRYRREMPSLVFPAAVHPSCVLGSAVTVGEGTIVMAGVVVNGPSQIGRHCAVCTRASMDHDSVLGDFSSLAPGVSMAGLVHVGEYSAIGTGAATRHRIRIGAHTVVGAGAAVVCDLPDYVVAFGVPARVHRSRQAGEPYL